MSTWFGSTPRSAAKSRRPVRTGVGRAIMSRLESDIVKRGHECATLDSSPNAVGFYVKLGYTPVGPLNDDGAVPMRKALRVRDLLSRRRITGRLSGPT